MQIQGVIFDMDGLMFDTERLDEIFWLQAAQEQGFALTQQQMGDIRGNNAETICRKLEGWFPAIDYAAFRAREKQLAADFYAHNPVPQKPGLQEILRFLQGRGIPCAVASSSLQTAVLHHLRDAGIVDFFQAVICGDMLAHSKPEPDIFYMAAEALDLPPAHCLVLEDSYNGVRAGAAGGFPTIMVPDRDPATDEMRALYTAEAASLTEVQRMLERGEGGLQLEKH